jgi:hypothetical protein
VHVGGKKNQKRKDGGGGGVGVGVFGKEMLVSSVVVALLAGFVFVRVWERQQRASIK